MISSDWQSQIFETKTNIQKNTRLNHWFSLKFHAVIAYNIVYHIVEVKPTKRLEGPKFGSNGPKMRGFFPNFLKFVPLVSISFLLYCIER